MQYGEDLLFGGSDAHNSPMKLSIPQSADAVGELLLESTPFSGRCFRVETSVCQNPTCRCDFVTLRCIPDPRGPSDPAVVVLEMDLRKRSVANLKDLDAANLALAETIVSEMSEEGWAVLKDIYATAKQRATEQADIETLDVSFPAEVMGREAAMAGYYEIFPHAKPIEVSVGSATWIVDDQYCVKPSCSCREAVLSFIQVPPPGSASAPTEPTIVVRYGYESGHIETLLGADNAHPSRAMFFDALKAGNAGLNSLLAKRQSIMRRLYKRALGLKTEQAPVKPGRNDYCPCGSGKKYKKCCGA